MTGTDVLRCTQVHASVYGELRKRQVGFRVDREFKQDGI